MAIARSAASSSSVASVPSSSNVSASWSSSRDERSDRGDARADRAHSAEGVIPPPLWIVLFLSAATLFVFMLIFADSGEHAVVQATMMGGVAVLVTSLLLLLWFLDHPYRGGAGALRPVAMQSTLEVMQTQKDIAAHVDDPCDDLGSPRS